MPKKPAPQLEPYQWKKGQSGNPDGRPPGSYGVKKRFELSRKALAYPLKFFSPKAFSEFKKKFPQADEDITIDEVLMVKLVTFALDDKSEGDLVLRVHKHLRDEGFGKLPEGEEPDVDEESNSPIVQIVIDGKPLKSDKIE